MLKNRHDAFTLLSDLGAAPHLIRHLQLVGKAADALLQAYADLGIACNAASIELGAAVHDAGKIEYPAEMYAPGSRHEAAGERLLLAHGVEIEIARHCVAHADWLCASRSFEERTVALADKLWKGKREAELELLIVDEAAARLACTRWDIFNQLDSVFEEIAADGAQRLQRSIQV